MRQSARLAPDRSPSPVAQAIPSAELLVVTTPQATATHVAGRVAKLAERTKLKVIGVIENMSYYDNDGKLDLFVSSFVQYSGTGTVFCGDNRIGRRYYCVSPSPSSSPLLLICVAASWFSFLVAFY